MTRHEIIQKLINKINAQSYVEIGLGGGEGFMEIKCPQKYGVDPQYGDFDFAKGTRCAIKPTHMMTSDQFFAQNKETFDVIFIDGLHHSDYVERDIINSIHALSDHGYIVCHDMNPTDKNMQIIPRTQGLWTGDCWKAWVKTRTVNPNVNMFVVDTDFGCGIIQKGSQELLDLNGLEMSYENLEANRQKWLNLISVDEFNQKLLDF